MIPLAKAIDPSRVVAQDSSQSIPTRSGVTFEEFVASLDDSTWAEWVDGEVIRLSPASTRHQRIKAFVHLLLAVFARSRDAGEVLDAPFLVVLPAPSLRGREPDVLFVSRARLGDLKETRFEGAPDLIVEIVSPESISRDRGEKFVEYEASGVREYWLIDPDRQQAEFYQLQPSGRYRLISTDGEGVYRSAVLDGLWLRVEWLWQEPLPNPVDVLKQLGVL